MTSELYDPLPSEKAQRASKPSISSQQGPRKSISSASGVKADTESTRRSSNIIQNLSSWSWELVASFFVLAIPLLILGTLYPHAGQPVPQWPFKISVNALLSIYGVVFRTCLTFVVASCIGQLQWAWFTVDRPLYDMSLYNNAANGAWGSLRLFWSRRIRQPRTALGAFILLLSVAIDPFIQQLLTTTDCNIKLPDEKAMLPRTNSFSLKDPQTIPIISPGSAFDSLTTSISNAETYLPRQCSTGNCTFSEVYGTLGYCSSCKDLSSNVIITRTNNRGCSSPTDTSLYCTKLWGINSSLYMGDDIPDEPWLNMTSWPDMCVARSWSSMYRNSKFGMTILKGATQDSLLGVDPLTGNNLTGCTSPDDTDTWYCRGYGAASCALQPCVRFYNATINRCQLKERLIHRQETSNSVDNINGLYQQGWGIVDMQCVSEDESGNLKDRGYTIDSRWVQYNFTSPDMNDTLESSLLEHECLYKMMLTDAYSFLDRWFIDATNGTVQVKAVMDEYNSSLIFSDFSGPQMIQILYNGTRMDFEGLNRAFANISEMATAWVRTHGNTTYSNPALGDVIHYATCLQVNWAWLAFPTVLALLTLPFFIMVAVDTSVQQMPVWKSTPLAWIMRWSHNFSESALLSNGTIDDMEEISKTTVVTFSKEPKPHVYLVTQ
ncbi:hypothetical protein GGR52DRAFT_448583 [Hypoxylon sp. FL1284]|nr:hypothetical protein GGR52DRAFT_448583 [Hypoxylon sp. FL1284]